MEKIQKFEAFSQSEIDRILDKINATGIGSLTAAEKRYLDDPEGNSLNSFDEDDETDSESGVDMSDLYIVIYDSDVEEYSFGFGIFSKSGGSDFFHQIDSHAEDILDEEILEDFEEMGIEEVGECDFLVAGDDWTLDSLKEYLHGVGFSDVRYNGK